MFKETVLRIVLLVILLASGCSSDDSRVAEVATAAADRQAEQSLEMAKTHGHLTQGAQNLAESVGRSQESLITIQKDLETQQAEIGRQRDRLELERQTIASQRRADPVIANAILQIGLLLACLLPLTICWYLLPRTDAKESDALVAEALIEDLTSSEPKLLPGPLPIPTEPRGLLPPD